MSTLSTVKAHGGDWESVELPTICMSLRMACNGSADPWSNDDVTACLSYLRNRINRWTTSFARTERFDEAVRALVLATIAEAEIGIRAPVEIVP